MVVVEGMEGTGRERRERNGTGEIREEKREYDRKGDCYSTCLSMYLLCDWSWWTNFLASAVGFLLEASIETKTLARRIYVIISIYVIVS